MKYLVLVLLLFISSTVVADDMVESCGFELSRDSVTEKTFDSDTLIVRTRYEIVVSGTVELADVCPEFHTLIVDTFCLPDRVIRWNGNLWDAAIDSALIISDAISAVQLAPPAPIAVAPVVLPKVGDSTVVTQTKNLCSDYTNKLGLKVTFTQVKKVIKVFRFRPEFQARSFRSR